MARAGRGERSRPRHVLRLEGFYATGFAGIGEGVGAAVAAERFDAGGAEFFAGECVWQMEFDAIAVAGVDEEADAVVAGVAGDEGDERVEPGAVLFGVSGFVEEEAEGRARR